MDTPLLADDFKEFLRLLNANRVEYLLVGGYAVVAPAIPAGIESWRRASASTSCAVTPA